MLGLPLGSDMIGGIDIDHALLGLVADALGDRWQKIDRTDPRTREGLAVLRTAAVAAKEALSSQLEVTVPVRLPCLTAEVVISRAALEDAIQPLVEQTVHLMLEVVEQAGLVARDLDRILLVGGSSRLPMVSRILTRELGVAVVADAHPKYAVCLGAAIASGSQLEPVESAASRPPIAASRPSTAPAEDVSLAVDLASRGLTEATHVPIRPAAELRRWRPAHPENEALVASIGTDESSRRDVRRALLIIGVLLALAAFTITVVLSLRH